MPQATVRWFDPDKGFGFLALGDDAEDLFVHASQVVGGPEPKVLREGQVVEYELGEGDRGPQARRVRVVSELSPSAALGVLGTVEWYEPTKGYGFVAPDDGGAQVFVHSSAIVGGTVLGEGQRVAFLVVEGEKGPQADHVLPLKAQPAADGADGTVTWYDEIKGFGFIKPDAGGEDVFVHARSLTGGLTELDEGDRVAFDVVAGDKGPQAREVRLPRARGRSGPDRSRSERQGSARGAGEFRGGARHDDRDARRPRGEARGAQGSGRGGEGVVTRYDADRGFGFISPDDGGPDLFVHVSVLRGGEVLEPGDRVRFVSKQGDRGPQADRVERADRG